MALRRQIVGAALGLVGLASVAGAQPVFDHMKCYAVRDSIGGRQFTADLHPRDLAKFTVEPGDVLVGGKLQPGCRIRTPAKFFCTDVDPRNSRSATAPFDPTQWTVRGPEAGDRLCYKLKCPPVTEKPLDVVDQFGSRRITVRGKPMWFCTPIFRPASPTEPCNSGGDGQCGGVCPAGQRCLALSGEECGCLAESQACSQVSTCQSGRCPGLWETCAIQPLGVCGCTHP